MPSDRKPPSIGLDALTKVVEAIGLTNLAAACGTRYQIVQQWLDPSRKAAAPAEFCPSIERVSREKGLDVRCEDLRPDVDWAVLRDSQRSPRKRVATQER